MPAKRRTIFQLALALKPKVSMATPSKGTPRLVKAERERLLAEIIAEVQRTQTHAVTRVGRMRIYAYRRADGRIAWTINYRSNRKNGVAE